MKTGDPYTPAVRSVSVPALRCECRRCHHAYYVLLVPPCAHCGRPSSQSPSARCPSCKNPKWATPRGVLPRGRPSRKSLTAKA